MSIYCRAGEVPAVAQFRGVTCVQLPAIRSRELSTLSHGVAAAVQARRAAHDVVLVVNVANALSTLLLRGSGGRVVLNTDGQEWLRGKWGPLARKVFWWSAKISGWSANALVSDCAAMRDVYLRDFGVESTVIPYCWTELVPTRDRAVFDRLGLRSRDYLLAAGRLVPENNLVEIARAYLAHDLPHRFVVLGAAPSRSPVAGELERMAARDERLVLPGHIDDRSLFAALVAEAAVYVHGHSVGGINPGLVEAMGCGARIVALDTPFNREALGPQGAYFGAAAEGLAPALDAVVAESVATSTARRQEASARARERFGLSRVADAYEQLLVRVAGLPRPWSTDRLVTGWEDGEDIVSLGGADGPGVGDNHSGADTLE